MAFLTKKFVQKCRQGHWFWLNLINRAYSANTIIDPTFGLTSGQKELQASAFKVALKEFRPFMREWDEKEYYPREVFRKLAQFGYGGLYTSVEDGGLGLSHLETSIIFEALAQGGVTPPMTISAQNLCVSMVSKYGSDALKSRFLAPMIAMEKMASYALTEAGSGSDAASLITTAKREDGYYVLNGTKAFTSGGGESDVYFVLCRTGGSGPKGISCILVEKGTKGLSFGKKEKKLGWNSLPSRAVIMEDCKVPVENLLGEENMGFHYALAGLTRARVNLTSCSLGAAQWALEVALEHCSSRKQFKRPLIEFQNTSFKLAEYASELLACRLLVRAAAQRFDQDNNIESDVDNSHFPIISLGAAAKLMTTEKTYAIIDGCLQLLGGYGYLKDFPVEQLLRDTRVHRIGEGTSEIMHLIIARDFIK